MYYWYSKWISGSTAQFLSECYGDDSAKAWFF